MIIIIFFPSTGGKTANADSEIGVISHTEIPNLDTSLQETKHLSVVAVVEAEAMTDMATTPLEAEAVVAAVQAPNP